MGPYRSTYYQVTTPEGLVPSGSEGRWLVNCSLYRGPFTGGPGAVVALFSDKHPSGISGEELARLLSDAINNYTSGRSGSGPSPRLSGVTTWSAELPTETGYYWMWDPHWKSADIVHVRTDNMGLLEVWEMGADYGDPLSGYLGYLFAPAHYEAPTEEDKAAAQAVREIKFYGAKEPS